MVNGSILTITCRQSLVVNMSTTMANDDGSGDYGLHLTKSHVEIA